MTNRLTESLRRYLPEGGTLTQEMWWSRHRAVLALLWLHVVVIAAYALSRGFGLAHTVLEAGLVAAAAAAASSASLSRRVRTFAASLGLLSSSAVLVHLSGGLIEMHFHFFVMVAVVALYQDWIPFMAAIGYVLIHHGLIGVLDPESVYNHPAAIANPWRWAGIHAFFIAGISAASLVGWRLNETYLADRRRAEELLREETRIVETLNEVGRMLGSDLELEHVVQRVTDAGTDLTSAAFGAFFYNVSDDSGGSYLLYTLSGVPAEAFGNFPMPRNTPIFASTFAGEGVVRLDDVTADPRYGQVPPHHGMPEGHLPVRSYLAAPVKSRGDVIGGLFFGHPEPGKFTESDERIVAGIAAHAGVAVENARLYESQREARAQAEKARERLALVAEASRLLTASLELDRLLKGLVDLLVPRIADVSVIDVLDDTGMLRRAATAVRGGPSADGWRWPATLDRANPDHPLVRAVTSKRPKLIEEVTDDLLVAWAGGDQAYLDALRAARPTSAVIVPLLQRDDVMGVITLGTFAETGRRLGPEDLTLLEEIARRTAAAAENARLYMGQRAAAETLQHSLLPETLPEIAGVEMAARYVAGGPGVDIGGDWYDILVLPDGKLGLAMGDVVGRGISAASLMGQLRNALRALVLEGYAPAHVMARLNALLDTLARGDQMATLIYGTFDLETGILRMANAGHPPPALVGNDGVEYLEGGSGMPLGAVSRSEYTERTVVVAPGSTLVFFSDGLVESRHVSLGEGLERLKQVLRTAPADAEGLCTVAVKERISGGEAADDVALLALRLLPLGNHFRVSLPSEPNVLRPLRATMRRWLREVGASDEEASDILVATGEACANVIRHAATDRFEVDADRNGQITIEVRDRGAWRAAASRSNGGRGLLIIEQLIDEVHIVRGPPRTVVTLRHGLSAREPAEAR